jgi:hypothetical protein
MIEFFTRTNDMPRAFRGFMVMTMDNKKAFELQEMDGRQVRVYESGMVRKPSTALESDKVALSILFHMGLDTNGPR